MRIVKHSAIFINIEVAVDSIGINKSVERTFIECLGNLDTSVKTVNAVYNGLRDRINIGNELSNNESSLYFAIGKWVHFVNKHIIVIIEEDKLECIL